MNITGVIAVGDFYQIPCVIPHQLYENSEFLPRFAREGHFLFKSFQKFQLSENCRQKDDEQFQEFLTRVRHRKVIQEDINLLNSRLYKNIPQESRVDVLKSVAIFPKNVQVFQWNENCLIKLNQPIVKIPILEKKSEITDIEPLFLCKNATVVLTKNLSLKHKLVNGSRGEVIQILYSKKQNQTVQQPAFIFVHFADYTGPVCDKVNGKTVIPIKPINDTYYDPLKREYVKVKAFPLKLGYGSTVHGIQSLTLDSCLVFFDKREFWLNQAYVCLSRLRSIHGLTILDSEIQPDRFTFQLERNYTKFCEMLRSVDIEAV